ncbi:MAG TPA: toll/interleukin-1 receptor domain-containing protein [Pseudonocardiaceae bacterium]|nr:toll/interleukin-1 receptor domain-containing protein [Pseudonocardiaceae bacterium]
MAKIFVNYRGGDGQNSADLLKYALSEKFGADEVFLAPNMIKPGSDFERELLRGVRACEVLLAVVGPNWLTATNAAGARAIEADGDWVRREIAEAFASGARVVPVLLDNATRLTDAALPDDIERLRRCQYLRLRHADFQSDLNRIVAELAKYVPRREDDQDTGRVTMRARASGHSRVYQAGGDMVVNE